MPTKNLRSIDNIDTNDMNFKHLETTKDIVISPKNEYGDPRRPDATHKWSAKVSDGTNYVGDYAVKINGASLIVDSEDFTKLPVGKYMLEVWEQWTDPDGNSQLSIYPSPQQTIPFTIYANITDQAGKEIKKIGFQDLVDKAVIASGQHLVIVATNTLASNLPASVTQEFKDGKNQLTFNIPKGEQGPAGPFPKLEVGTLTKLPNNAQPVVTPTPIDGGYRFDIGIPVGASGNDGHTPVKGTDYWTASDQQSIQDQIKKITDDAFAKAKAEVEDAVANGKY